MSKSEASARKKQKPGEIDAAAVADYLARHPDFLKDHPDLLETLEVPHETGAATSLVEYQVSLLRDRNAQLNRKLKDLVAIARENEALMERVHRLTLKVMDAGDLPTLVSHVETLLREDFQADAVRILVFGETDPKLESPSVFNMAPDDGRLAPFGDFLSEASPLCGRLRQEKLAVLFGDDAENIRSAALLPLDEECRTGVLGIGSYEEDRFHPGMGTVFLKLMGQVLGRSLSQHLARPERRRA